MGNPKLNGTTRRLLAEAQIREMQQKQQTLIALKLESVIDALFQGFAGSPGVALSALLSLAAKVGLANGATKETVAGAFEKIWHLAEQVTADKKAEEEGKPLPPSRLDVSRIPGTLPGSEDIRTTCLAVLIKATAGEKRTILVSELELADTEGLNVVFNQVSEPEPAIELSLERTAKPVVEAPPVTPPGESAAAETLTPKFEETR